MISIFDKMSRTGAALKLGGLLLAASVAVSGCDLDRYPTKTFPLDGSIETFQDADNFNNGVMAQFRNRTTGFVVYPQEYMADCVNASIDWGNSGEGLHGWKALSASDGDISGVYSWYYGTLKNVNYTLANYPRVREQLAKERDAAKDDNQRRRLAWQVEEMDLFIGTSAFVRAYYYFNLLLRYGTPYSAATADKDLGVPLVVEFDVEKNVKRSTVKQVYDQIFKDLDVAEKVLTLRESRAGASEFTPDCVTALRARMALERKEYDKAYAYATELIESGRYPLVAPTKEAFEEMWQHDKSTEDILILYISKNETAYSNGYYYGYNDVERRYEPNYYPTQGLLDMYSPKDLRKDVYFYLAPVAYINKMYFRNQMYLISKYKGNPEYYVDRDRDGKYIPNGQHRPRIFRIAEQYLIAAEAAYFSGKDALKPLNALRASRGLEPVASSGEQLLKDIQDERCRELMGEGFRLWDLRRWGLPIKRMAPQILKDKQGNPISPKNYLAQGYYELDIEPTDPLYKKIVWAIPQREINTYGAENMPQNPGW